MALPISPSEVAIPPVRGNRLTKALLGFWSNVTIGKLFTRLGPRATNLLALLICLSVGAATSVLLGQDSSWDLKNYHLYLGSAAMSGRVNSDFLNLQMYFNPILDAPYAWLALGPLSDHPRMLAAIMGLWYGALIALVWMLARQHYASWTRTRRNVAIVGAVVVASTGTAVIAQVGTTSNEIQDSALVLAGLLILQTLFRTETSAAPSGVRHPPLPVGSLLAAGAFLGLATGLKLTASIYSPAACMALLGVLPFRRWITWCLLIVAGWVPAFALSAGWWAWQLWIRFSNPYFPFLNGLFRSEWYPPVSFFDRRFMPHGGWQWLFYPLDWTRTQSSVIESPFRDWRGGTVLLLGFVVALVTLACRTRLLSRLAKTDFGFSKEQKLLLAFLFFSYVFWLCTSSILRYAIPIEVAAGISIPLLIDAICSRLPRAIHHGLWAIAIAALITLIVFTTRYPHSERARYGSPIIQAHLGRIAPGTMVILGGGANTYVAPFLPTEARSHLISVDHDVMEARGFRFYDAVMERIREHHGPYLVLWDPSEIWVPTNLEQVGLALEMSTCRDLRVTIGAEPQPLQACGAHLQIMVKLTSKFWRQAADHYKRIEVHEKWRFRWSYPAFVQAVGAASHGIDIIDIHQKLWPLPMFGTKIRSDTLYVFNSDVYKNRAAKTMDAKSDMLSEIDGFLVLAPGWKKVVSPSPSRTAPNDASSPS